MMISTDIYPDVTPDPRTWPVYYRYTDEEGREIVTYDPTPWDRKQAWQAQQELRRGLGDE